MRTLAISLLILTSARAHKFEVASVKPAGPPHGGRTAMVNGPERVVVERQSLLRFIYFAYGVDFDQISGPKWLSDEYYEVNAKIPPGSTKEQIRLMWQDLLAERFGLKIHMSEKELPAYELVVAKGGPKFHVESGFPEPPAGGRRGIASLPPRTFRQTFRGYTMQDFCHELAWVVAAEDNQPWPGYTTVGRVVDKTGLDAKYDFTLEFAGRLQFGAYPAPLPDGQTDTAPFIFEALQRQLGLKLVEKKIPVPVVVVDAVNKVPTEN